MSRRSVLGGACAVFVALFVCGAAGGTSPRVSALASLPGGFAIADGSELVGVVFPETELGSPSYNGVPGKGKTAFLDVTGDAGSVLNAYVTQATG